MKLYSDLVLKFEKSDWSKNPEFGVIDTILELHPEIYHIFKSDIIGNEDINNFGRKDTPTVEQIVRAAIYKEMKGYDYRELEYAQSDSRICATFIKLDMRSPFCFQTFQKYISRIKEDTLHKVLVEVIKIAADEGYEDISKIRQDSTVVKSNIHYPTNNSLVWDCIKESHRLLSHLKEEVGTLSFIDYTKSAKSTYFKINVTKSKDKQVDLFNKQLIAFTKAINQVSNIVKKKFDGLKAYIIVTELEALVPIMEQVYSMTYWQQIKGENVPNDQKLFSIYEGHTDIIVKGGREVLFGHKVNLTTGKSNLIIDCHIPKGNPSDTILFKPTLDRVIDNYGIIPRDSSTDGGYASKENSDYCRSKGLVNIVFNKVVGSLQNIATSLKMETILKKWRSGIEGVISNLKRGFDLRVCAWKGFAHFKAKVMWSVLAYNFRVLTNMTLSRIAGFS
ncbi:MAG: ISNCY family transposase [Bacteroidetes bacterium]|nr:ISNCY family transposase [Bacteroidota bacterium]